MRRIIALLMLTLAPLVSQDIYQNYQPQSFFSSSDSNTFKNDSQEGFLQKILINNHEYLMQQDGELYDEDVATIDDEIFSAKGEKYSFSKSKRLLATKVYPSHQKAFYSNCDYEIKEKKLIPIHESCGFHYRKNEKRSKRIEWEHVVPAWHFGYQLQCWQKGGRANCKSTDAQFRKMESDMHNLVPAIGEINGDRSNFRYGLISGEKRLYGKVDVEIDFSSRRAEPRKVVWGEIARTYFYMREKYGLEISKAQEKLFIAWNNLDPVTRWERKRNELISEIQGNDNPYVSHYRKIEQLGAIPKTDKEQESSSSNTSHSLDAVKSELEDKYGLFLNKIPSPYREILLLLIAFVVLYFRKRKN